MDRTAILGLALIGATSGLAHAGAGTYTSDSSMIGTLDAHANFNALVDGQSLLNYAEDGLIVSSTRTYFSWDAPGLDGSEMFYPNTGALELVEISRVGGSDFTDLDMQISTGWSPDEIGVAYLWAQLFDGGNLVAEFDIDALSGDFVGFTGGGFDQLRIGAYVTADIRDAHDPTARNAIAIDNLTAGIVPAPASAAPLLTAGLLASRRRRH